MSLGMVWGLVETSVGQKLDLQGSGVRVLTPEKTIPQSQPVGTEHNNTGSHRRA